LGLGIVLGAVTALTLSYFRPARRWLMPVLVFSQAIPVFALAPLLVLWMGYGMASKIAMATLIIYFPVTSAFFDGLRRTEPGWLDLAQTMGGSRWSTLLHIRLPAALPAFASGLRVATAVAPIGAVVGEWVGASAGLGYLMLHANGRMQVDLMFAALLTLAVISVTLYFAVDALLRRALPWQPDKNPNEERD
jgi:putative hydroxymethylpyrimidine transport system permease protein